MAWMRRIVVAALVVLLAGLSGTPFARGAAAEAPRIEAVDVERVADLAAGTRLRFSLFGTPGGQALLQIDGARAPVEMREVEPGVYDGSYTIGADDRIAPGARVSATLRLGGHTARSVLDEPLLLGDGPPEPAAPAQPRPMPEPPPMPAPSPWPTPSPTPAPTEAPSPAPAPMEAPPPFNPPPPSAPPPACSDCAVVESIRPVEAATPAGGPMTVLLGDRIGGAVERHVARVVDTIDRALHGRPPAPEPRRADATPYDVVLRLPNGERVLRRYDRLPPLQVGDRLRRGTDLGGARSERLLNASP